MERKNDSNVGKKKSFFLQKKILDDIMADDLTDSQKKEYKVAFDKYADGDKLRAKKLSVVCLIFIFYFGEFSRRRGVSKPLLRSGNSRTRFLHQR